MEITFLSYNVSGIPLLGDFQGTQRKYRGAERQRRIGALLSWSSGADIIGVQEDFDNHGALESAMSAAYPYRTVSSGPLPLGSGENLFSAFPIYNVTRIPWRSTFGVLCGAMDRIADKGILSATVEIAEGVFIDVYVIHTDAGAGEPSVRARADNFRQLAEVINASSVNRACVVIGDYNTKYIRNAGDDVYGNLIIPAGLTDAWAALHNGGDSDYNDGKAWLPTLPESIDKVMFRSGGSVSVTPVYTEYVKFTDADGNTYTDHVATKTTLSFEVTGRTGRPERLVEEEPVDERKRKKDLRRARAKTAGLVLSHLYELAMLPYDAKKEKINNRY